jgi:hypothetical protein
MIGVVMRRLETRQIPTLPLGSFGVNPIGRSTFNKAFAGANKSAVVAQLMRQAVEERRRQNRRRRAIERLLRLRRTIRPVAEVAIRAARVKGRP